MGIDPRTVCRPLMRILAVDPGRDKCGVVVMDARTVLARAVVPTPQVLELITDWSSRYGVKHVLVGDRTGSKEIVQLVASALRSVPLTLVAETGTTLEARKRYFRDHPPRGWRRFVPVTLQVPSRPYDDYAAVILGEHFIDQMSTDIK
jgi:RNase H-fold protein (predicted Holliday junction resolvase)